MVKQKFLRAYTPTPAMGIGRGFDKAVIITCSETTHRCILLLVSQSPADTGWTDWAEVQWMLRASAALCILAQDSDLSKVMQWGTK